MSRLTLTYCVYQDDGLIAAFRCRRDAEEFVRTSLVGEYEIRREEGQDSAE